MAVRDSSKTLKNSLFGLLTTSERSWLKRCANKSQFYETLFAIDHYDKKNK